MRSAHLGIFQSGVLMGAAAGPASNEVPPLVRASRTIRLVYSSMVQAGIDQIRVSVGGLLTRELPAYLSRRVRLVSSPEWGVVQEQVQAAFRIAIGPDYDWRADPHKIRLLEIYVIELLHAWRTATSLIWVTPFPNMEWYRVRLPPELYVPIRNLLATARPLEPTVAAPASVIKRADLGLLEEILVGNAYASYTRSHDALADPSVSPARALASVSRASGVLVRAHRQLLRHHKTSALVLDASANAVEAMGKVPGALAGLIATLLGEWAQSRTRVVIYDFEEILSAASGLDLSSVGEGEFVRRGAAG